jgi:hypothetical protein
MVRSVRDRFEPIDPIFSSRTFSPPDFLRGCIQRKFSRHSERKAGAVYRIIQSPIFPEQVRSSGVPANPLKAGAGDSRESYEETDMKVTESASFSACLTVLGIFLSCAVGSKQIESIDRNRFDPGRLETITSPVKAHLTDGSVILFDGGCTASNGKISGLGKKYNLVRGNQPDAGQISVPLDSLIALESVTKEWGDAGFFFGSIPPVLVGLTGLAVAIFGSCPTVYTGEGPDRRLEAECFSYGITKSLQCDDLDRLEYGKSFAGRYSLTVTNEALETHYINRMALMTVDHPDSVEAIPSPDNKVLLFGKQAVLLKAENRYGDDVLPLVQKRDGLAYQSGESMVAELSRRMTRDWIDLTVRVPGNAKKAVLALRFRNTLMNTVLLYDVMLGSRGFRAVDWIQSGVGYPFGALRMRSWYHRHFGMDVEMYDGVRFNKMTHIADTGPIAWHQEAVELPRAGMDTARIRLSFLPDNAAIDWIGVSFDDCRDARIRTIPCALIRDRAGRPMDALTERIRDDDDAFMITYPGDLFRLEYVTEEPPEGLSRSYFLRSRGFYIEWIRREWLENPPEAGPFAMNDAAILKTAGLWLGKKDRYERDFFGSRFADPGGN